MKWILGFVRLWIGCLFATAPVTIAISLWVGVSWSQCVNNILIMSLSFEITVIGLGIIWYDLFKMTK